MKRKSIYELLEEVSKVKTAEQKIQKLREVDNGVLRMILKYALDPNIEFALPKGEPPFKPCPFLDQQGMLYTEARRLYLFVRVVILIFQSFVVSLYTFS